MTSTPPTVLTIAASDPSGSTGVEEDLKVITVHGCYGLSTITALAVRNARGVSDIHSIPPDFVKQSLDTVLGDNKPNVVKTGMLASVRTLKAIAQVLQKRRPDHVVMDPIMDLSSKSWVSALLQNLLPMVSLVTPDISEAIMLVKTAYHNHWPDIRIEEDLVMLATMILALGPKSVLLRNCHLQPVAGSAATEDAEDGKVFVDIFYDGKNMLRFDRKHIRPMNTPDIRGALASAIASNLSKGFTMIEAVTDAIGYIERVINASSSMVIGERRNPLHHARNCYVLPFDNDHLVDYLLNHPKVRDVWHRYTRHDFVKLLGTGQLDTAHFKYYLIQDYLFLTQLARCNSLAAYKRHNIKEIAKAARLVTNAEQELTTHIEYCRIFGISEAEIENAEEDSACTSYSRYILDVAATSDFLAAQVATLACTVGYAEIGRWLYDDPDTKRANNPYWEWILYYTSAEYKEGVQISRKLVENEARGIGLKKLEELVNIFARVTTMEERFWSMALAKSA